MDENGKKRNETLRRRLSCMLAALCLAAVMAPAHGAEQTSEARRLIPVGHTAGVKLFSDGLMVVQLAESMDGSGRASPARACGLQTGDILLEMNREHLSSTEALQEALQKNEDRPVSLTVQRGAQLLSLTTVPQSDGSGAYRLGAWVRDSMAGIGTITYADPETLRFGALGHGIADVDTGLLMPISSGSLMPSEVAEIKKGKRGVPGELQGDFQISEDMGALTCNSDFGIFGRLADRELLREEALETAKPEEVRCGDAIILCNIEGNAVKPYHVKITKLCKAGASGRDMMLRVTDPELLSKTGGIVQGMSGSPIIQNGKLVGAVTHVLVNSPDKGYGIFVEHMLEAEK